MKRNERSRWFHPAAVMLAAVMLAALQPLAAWGGAAESPLAEVRVLPQAEVPGAGFTLGEVAEIDGSDLDMVRRLAALQIGTSPLPGRELRLNASLIRSRMARLIDPRLVAVKVPDGATVVRSAHMVPGREIADLVLEYASGQAKMPEADLEQELVGRVPDALLPTGEVDWRIDALGSRLTPGGTRTYKVEAVVHDQVAWKQLVRIRQNVFREVVLARRPIRRNQVIHKGDLAVQRMKVSGMRQENYLAKAELAEGQKAKRPIARGEWLHAGLLDKLADVPEGGPVILEYKTERLHVRVPGVAMVPGKVGAFIPVRNLQSGKIVYGVVQEGDRVLVN